MHEWKLRLHNDELVDHDFDFDFDSTNHIADDSTNHIATDHTGADNSGTRDNDWFNLHG
jgi:hypothetical protein